MTGIKQKQQQKESKAKTPTPEIFMLSGTDVSIGSDLGLFFLFTVVFRQGLISLTQCRKSNHIANSFSTGQENGQSVNPHAHPP